MTARRAFSISFAAVVGGVLAVSLGGLAISDALSDGDQGSAVEGVVAAPGKPLSESLRVFSGAREVTDSLPTRVASQLQSLIGSAPADLPARLRPGALRLDEGRLLLSALGPHNAALYAVPTSSGNVCLAFTGGPSGCEKGFTVSPIGFSSFDPDQLGAGEPYTVYGLVPNDVTRIEVVVAGKPQTALLKNNGFYYRLSDPATWPEAIDVTFSDGRAETITLAPPPKLPK